MNVNSVITLLHQRTDRQNHNTTLRLTLCNTPSTYESQNTNQCQFFDNTAMSRAVHNRHLLSRKSICAQRRKIS